MKKIDLNKYSREELAELVEMLQEKLKKRNDQLKMARHRLNNAKNRVRRMQEVVSFQRERILELYSAENSEVQR